MSKSKLVTASKDWNEWLEKYGEEYYDSAKKDITKSIENNFDKWTNPNMRYCLLTTLYFFDIFQEGINGGNITDTMHFRVYSEKLDKLQKLFKTEYFQHRYSTPCQHFIVDTKTKKVVDFLSICA